MHLSDSTVLVSPTCRRKRDRADSRSAWFHSHVERTAGPATGTRTGRGLTARSGSRVTTRLKSNLCALVDGGIATWASVPDAHPSHRVTQAIGETRDVTG